MKLIAVIERGEDRGFVVHVPALRGCWSQGATRVEALRNIQEAAELCLEADQDLDAAPSVEIELVDRKTIGAEGEKE